MLTKLMTAVAGARSRPPRSEVEPVALELIRRHGAEILAVARRYSQNHEDAEDAYQRGLEILLTKAPSTSPSDLVPWLKTVVKHEAFALHRQRERHGGAGSPDEPFRQAHPSETHEVVEQLERLQIGAEALRRLKPQETRCMLLLAEGHSYKQIQELTGFSYTKVNRCLTEGRRSFLRRVEGIESGAECERLAPLLSAMADGEASARDMALLRPHLRTCLSCRAALRDARELPARVAALAPVGLLVGRARPSLRSLGDWLQDRFAWAASRGQDLVETAGAHKIAAVAASAAALGGGGIATVQVASSHHPHRHHAPRVAAAPAPAPAKPLWRPAAAVTPPRSAPPSTPDAHRQAPQRRKARPHRVPAQPAAAAPTPAIEPAGRVATPAPAKRPESRRLPAPATQPPPGQTGEFGP
jgi:RNA polymerase sigma factor (sigma-70 family)